MFTRIGYRGLWWLVSGLIIGAAGWYLPAAHADHLKRTFDSTTLQLPDRGLALRPDGIQLGPLNLQPRLIMAETYDDNIFLTDTDRKDDFITTIRPALNLVLPWRTHQLSVGYEAEFQFFAEHNDESVLNQALNIDLGVDFPAGLRLRLRDRYLNTHDPSSSQEETRTGDPRAPRTQNDSEIRATYALSPKTAFETAFLRTMHNYRRQTDDELDRNDNIVSLTFFHRILPKTSILVGYDFQRTNFIHPDPADPDDSRTHTGSVGLRFDPTAKVAGTLRLGYSVRHFDNHAGQSFDNTQALTADAALVWAARPKTQIYLDLLRDIEASLTEDANAVISTRLALALRQRLIQPFSVEILTWYQRDAFAGLDRTDNLWQGIAVARYRVLPGLHVAAGYEYGVRNSSDNTFDFTVHRFWLLASWPTAFSFRDIGALFASFFGTLQEFRRFENPSPIRNRN